MVIKIRRDQANGRDSVSGNLNHRAFPRIATVEPRRRRKRTGTRRRSISAESLEARRLLAVCLAETESNDSIATAGELSLIESPGGTGVFQACGEGSSSSGDNDYWSIEALAGDRISVHSTSTDGALNSRLTLFNSAGGQLAIDYDSGTGSNAALENYLIGSSGTYYARVSRDGGAGPYDIQFDLSRDSVTLETDANNANDSLGDADVLGRTATGNESTGSVSGIIAAASDTDLFLIGTLGAGSVVDLSLSLPTDSELDAAVELLSASGDVVTDSDGVLDGGFTSDALLDSGRYYARGDGGSRDRHEWISITLRPRCHGFGFHFTGGHVIFGHSR